jgi:hypothetical protein
VQNDCGLQIRRDLPLLLNAFHKPQLEGLSTGEAEKGH